MWSKAGMLEMNSISIACIRQRRGRCRDGYERRYEDDEDDEDDDLGILHLGGVGKSSRSRGE
jgi:hypothetical protein